MNNKKTTPNISSVIKPIEMESLLSSINSATIVEVTDLNGKIIYANDNFCRISGYDLDELIGQDHRILKSDEHDKKFFTDMWNTIQSGKVWNGEVKNKAKDGSYYWLFTTISPNLTEDGEIWGYTCIRFDITRKKEMENQLQLEKIKSIHSSKLALIGEMAVGVVHEINNPLTVINGSVLLLKNALKDIDEKTLSLLDNIDNSSERIIKIINSVKKFSRKQNNSVRENVSTAKLIADTHELIMAKLKRHQNVAFLVERIENKSFYCDSLALIQILANLITNAVDAVKDMEKPWVKLACEYTGSEFVFYVKDSGEGILDEIADNIFSPFYTTKGADEGTGLGLSISKQLAEDHGGELCYETIDGHTAFILRVPNEYCEELELAQG